MNKVQSFSNVLVKFCIMYTETIILWFLLKAAARGHYLHSAETLSTARTQIQQRRQEANHICLEP